jgi:hypothetical protein
MPKSCPNCQFTTDDLWMDGCPICLQPLTRVARSQSPTGFAGRVLSRRWLAALGLLGLLVVLPALPFACNLIVAQLTAGRAQQADATGRIRVGMHMHDVAWVLDPVPPRRSTDPHLSQSFPRADDYSGTLNWDDGQRVIRITFRNGRVTGVGEGQLFFRLGRGGYSISYDE